MKKIRFAQFSDYGKLQTPPDYDNEDLWNDDDNDCNNENENEPEDNMFDFDSIKKMLGYIDIKKIA